MRASKMVPGALSLAVLAGCARGSPARLDAAADAGAAEAGSTSGDGAADALAVVEPVFAPLPDGGASEVLRKDAPNMRYAQLERDACLAELGRRAIVFEEVSAFEQRRTTRRWAVRTETTPEPGTRRTLAPGAKPGVKPAAGAKPGAKPPPRPPAKKPAKPVPTKHVPEPKAPAMPTHLLAPVRLGGPLHGVAIHSSLPERKRTTSTIEIFDCRLVLALDDFAALLAEHRVNEVIHMSAYRSEGERGCTPKYLGKQHCAALAVDVGVFKKSDGTELDVDRDFNGKIGLTTCTTGAGPNPSTPAATELWTIVCDAARRGLFHVVLTPNYNQEHKNHFHLEITPDVTWMLIH
jgi:hypothetical protein